MRSSARAVTAATAMITILALMLPSPSRGTVRAEGLSGARHSLRELQDHTVLLPQHPFALVVDTPTHRVITLNADRRLMNPTIGLPVYHLSSISILDPTNAAALRTVWLRQYAESDTGTMAVDPQTGRVYVLTHGAQADAPGALLAFDGATGALLSSLPLGIMPRGLAIDGSARRIYVSAQGSVDAQNHVMHNGDIRIFDADSGKLLRIIGPGGLVGPRLFGGPIVVNAQHGRVFVANTHAPTPSAVLSVAVPSGTVVSSTPITAVGLLVSNIESLAVDAHHNHVLVGVADEGTAQMSVLDGTTGQPVTTTETAIGYSGDVTIAADETTGHAFVVAGSSSSFPSPITVSLLDLKQGFLLRNAAIDISELHNCYQHVAGVAVDEQRGHLIVAVDTADAPGIGICGPGYVAVLDAQSGAELQLIRVGPSPGWRWTAKPGASTSAPIPTTPSRCSTSRPPRRQQQSCRQRTSAPCKPWASLPAGSPSTWLPAMGFTVRRFPRSPGGRNRTACRTLSPSRRTRTIRRMSSSLS